MSKITETQLDELDKESANEPQLEVSPYGELAPFVDTRTEEQKAADEKLKQQVQAYQELYQRGEIGETAYNSAILHRLAGRFSIIREFQRAFTGQILRFMKPESECGYSLTLDQAIQKAESFMEGTTPEKLFNELKRRSVNSIGWLDLERLFRLEPAAAEALW